MPSEERSRDHDGGRAQAAGPARDSIADSLVVFRPSRWRVFMVLSAMALPVWLGLAVILEGVLFRWDWGDFVFCIGFLGSVGYQTWRAPDEAAVYVSDTEISDSWERTIRLADLDRVRSARRSPYDRLNGRQRLYSTNGTRINWMRTWFAGSDLRRLLDLLKLNEGNMS
jgi:hypothetical protein